MNDPNKIRVLIVDDHALIRSGLRFSLGSVDDIELVGEAQDGQDALRLCGETSPDVVVMDILLSGEMDGIATTRAVRTQHPQIQVLALSSSHDKVLVEGAMQAGAIGYLVKGGSVNELVEAIRAAHAGRTTLASEALEALIEPSPPTTRKTFDLTDNELETLVLLVEGRSNAEIAELMHVSVASVKYYVSGVLTKLGASNRTEAAAMAREYELVPKK